MENGDRKGTRIGGMEIANENTEREQEKQNDKLGTGIRSPTGKWEMII